MPKPSAHRRLQADNAELRARLTEAEQTLDAIRHGEVDALVVSGVNREQIFTLVGVDIAYRLLVEDMREGALMVTLTGLVSYCNRFFARTIKMPLEQVMGSSITTWVAASNQAQFQAMLNNSPHVNRPCELSLRASDGTEVAVYVSVNRHVGANTPDVFFIVITDLTEINERKAAEEKLALAASVFVHAREGILITAPDGEIIDVNTSFIRMTGYERDEVVGHNPRMFSAGRQNKEFYDAMWRDLVSKGHWYGEVWNRRKNGELYAVMLNISALRDALGNIRQYMGLTSDITVIKAHEKELEHLAHFDALTMLPNRVLLADRLQQGMVQVLRRSQSLAVAYLDLDKFKDVNDSLGHEIGDKLLIALANRMNQAIRRGDTLARIGGDEFVAVLLDIGDVQAAESTLVRLLGAAGSPVPIGEHVIQISASLGVTFYPQAVDVGPEQLLRQADQAMYQAKQAGKNRYQVFDAAQDYNLRSHYETVDRISHALSAREFVLYYQPKVNMRTGAVIGVEALIRWQHQERGLLAPEEFLPFIKDHPMSVALGEWVIEAALTQVEVWQAEGLSLAVSVNIGGRQLQQADFVERLQALLAAHPQVHPGDLEMEVLETSALVGLVWVSHVIDECRKLGVLFALDDFGTGYSSLTYLKRLPVNQLKIDQSFVQNMLHDPDDLSILDGVIGLAKAFRCQVIAEGVETVEHGTLLLQLGCELAQGYGIARPMPAHEMPAWRAAWQPDPAWRDVQTVDAKDFPLLFASVEIHALVRTLSEYIRGEGDKLPPIDACPSQFGKWVATEGQLRLGAAPAFQSVAALHQQVHDMAAELYALHAKGLILEAQKRLGELQVVKDALLSQLNALAPKIRF
jgi:diguanylate cyclase (GGDEF)-like protein/PAS domain S-box-containing protein